jgi:hypothetical protein
MQTYRIRFHLGHYRVLSRRYETERAAVSALAPYPTLDALVSILSGRDRADLPTRSRLLTALVELIQAGPSSLWSAVVLDAFRGMLGRLARSLKGNDRQEAYALVAASFCEALRRVRPERDPDRFAMYVRQETRRVVFARLSCPPDLKPDTPSYEDSRFDEPPAVEIGKVADPLTTAPIEDRLTVWTPEAKRVSDEDLLLAHGVRGGLRRLTKHLFPDVSARNRESIYRQLLRRAQTLAAHPGEPTPGPDKAGQG